MPSAVFLDRDGVINRNVFNPDTEEYESPGKPGDFELHDDVIPALRSLQGAGFLLFLVSNQPNFAKGKSSMEDLEGVHARLVSALDDAGIRFTKFFYCFHHPQGKVASHSGPCACRKPSPFFLLSARDEFDIDMTQSWMVGDRVSDIECGIAAGVKTIRVKEDHAARRPANETPAHYEARNLAHAAEIIAGYAVAPLGGGKPA